MALENVLKLHTEAYLADRDSVIQEAITTVKRIIIRGNAGIGKTYWVINCLYKRCKREGKELVLVLPNVENLNQILTRYSNAFNICILKQDATYKEGADIYISTPDSIDKIPLEVMEKAYLVADEYHTTVTDNTFRSIAFNKLEQTEKYAHKVIALTATDEMFADTDFDLNIYIDSNKKIEVENLVIRNYPSLPNDAKAEIIKELLSKHETLLVINDDIEVNKHIKEYLESQGYTGIYIYNGKERDGEHMDYLREHGCLPSYVKVLISTTAINSGIDINNDNDFASLYFCDKDYSLQKDIQAKARNRKGSKAMYTVLINVPATEEYKPLRSFNELESSYLSALTSVQIGLNSLLEVENETTHLQLDGLQYDAIEGQYVLNRRVVKRKALCEYNKGLAKRPYELAGALKASSTFNIKNCVVEYLDTPRNDELKALFKEIKEEKQALKEANEAITVRNLLKLSKYVEEQKFLAIANYKETTAPKATTTTTTVTQTRLTGEEVVQEIKVKAEDTRTDLFVDVDISTDNIPAEALKELKRGYLYTFQALYEDHSNSFLEETYKHNPKIAELILETQERGAEQLAKISKICYKYKIVATYAEAVEMFVEKYKEEKALQVEQEADARSEAEEEVVAASVAKTVEEVVDSITLKVRGKYLNKLVEQSYNLDKISTLDIRKKMRDLKVSSLVKKEYRVEEAVIYRKYFKRKDRITKDRLMDLYKELGRCGFIKDVVSPKEKAQALKEKEAKEQGKKFKAKKIAIPPHQEKELLTKINMLFNVTGLNQISSVNKP